MRLLGELAHAAAVHTACVFDRVFGLGGALAGGGLARSACSRSSSTVRMIALLASSR